MSRKCEITGTGPLTGNLISHAKNRTKRKQYPNLIEKRIYLPAKKKWVKVRLTASALRTVAKKGADVVLKNMA